MLVFGSVFSNPLTYSYASSDGDDGGDDDNQSGSQGDANDGSDDSGSVGYEDGSDDNDDSDDSIDLDEDQVQDDSEEICDNGIDDDGDGLTDGQDTITCPDDSEEICDNGIDDNNDGLIDKDVLAACSEEVEDGEEQDGGTPEPSGELGGLFSPLVNDKVGGGETLFEGENEQPLSEETGLLTVAGEICDDGFDNDGDNLVDIADDECAAPQTEAVISAAAPSPTPIPAPTSGNSPASSSSPTNPYEAWRKVCIESGGCPTDPPCYEPPSAASGLLDDFKAHCPNAQQQQQPLSATPGTGGGDDIRVDPKLPLFGIPIAGLSSTGQAPTGQAPTDQAPTDQTPPDQAPTDQTPTGQALAQGSQFTPLTVPTDSRQPPTSFPPSSDSSTAVEPPLDSPPTSVSRGPPNVDAPTDQKTKKPKDSLGERPRLPGLDPNRPISKIDNPSVDRSPVKNEPDRNPNLANLAAWQRLIFGLSGVFLGPMPALASLGETVISVGDSVLSSRDSTPPEVKEADTRASTLVTIISLPGMLKSAYSLAKAAVSKIKDVLSVGDDVAGAAGKGLTEGAQDMAGLSKAQQTTVPPTTGPSAASTSAPSGTKPLASGSSAGGGIAAPTPLTRGPPPVTSDVGSMRIPYNQPTTDRVMKLGSDPHRGGFEPDGNLPRNSQYEGTVAAIIEDKFGGFQRAPATFTPAGKSLPGPDFISQSGPLKGKSFDLVGVLPDKAGFVKMEGKKGLLNAISEHVNDPKWNTIVDMSNFNSAQKAMIRDHISKLPAAAQQRIFVVEIAGGSPPLLPLPRGSNSP